MVESGHKVRYLAIFPTQLNVGTDLQLSRRLQNLVRIHDRASLCIDRVAVERGAEHKVLLHARVRRSVL